MIDQIFSRQCLPEVTELHGSVHDRCYLDISRIPTSSEAEKIDGSFIFSIWRAIHLDIKYLSPEKKVHVDTGDCGQRNVPGK